MTYERPPAITPVTDKVAEFVRSLTYESLPQNAKNQMTIALIDYFRAGIAGLSMPWLEKVKAAFDDLGGAPISSVLYSDQRTDPIRAAYINGTITGSLDWDDTHVGAMLHPGVVVWPGVFALAEKVGATGEQMLAAAAAGYETDIRVGLGVQPGHFKRGFQATATCGVFGSAAAAAHILGLDKDGVRNALGIAGSYAGGVTQFFLSGSEVKRLHASKAAAAGVEAALIAAEGVSGPRDVLEGIQGFGKALGDGLDEDAVLDGLGDEYLLMGLQFKPHAASARVLSAIECAETIARGGVKPEDIETIEIGVPAVIVGRLTLKEYGTLQQAQMSAPYTTALTLVLASETPPPLILSVDTIGDHLGDARVIALVDRTTCVVDPEIDAGLTDEYAAGRVTVTLKDGLTVSETVMLPKGCWKRQMELDEIAERFKVVASPVVGENAAASWLAKAMQPDAVKSAAEFLTMRAK